MVKIKTFVMPCLPLLEKEMLFIVYNLAENIF